MKVRTETESGTAIITAGMTKGYQITKEKETGLEVNLFLLDGGTLR
jgi:hypothetical protein